ncbi:MAG: DUF3149 domain-containing protein [Gammaproteobacteria bacterium]|nr:DUF3149 domain-containing protein [Gammaproteobacteria bacterium]
MEVWKELLGTWVGQLSLAVIVVTMIMMAFFARLFIKKMHDAEAQEKVKANSRKQPIND